MRFPRARVYYYNYNICLYYLVLVFPNGEMKFSQMGESIFPNGEMHFTKWENGRIGLWR